jgi:hypothetical protein
MSLDEYSTLKEVIDANANSWGPSNSDLAQWTLLTLTDNLQ